MVAFQVVDAEPEQLGTPGIAKRVKFRVPLADVPELKVPLILKPTPPGAPGAEAENEFPVMPALTLPVVVKSAEQPDPVIWPPKDKLVTRLPDTVKEMLFPCPVVPDQLPS